MSKESKGLSRREVVKGLISSAFVREAASTVGIAAIVGGISMEKARAEVNRPREGESGSAFRDRGIIDLKNAVQSQEREQLAFFVTDSYFDKSRWETYPAGTDSSVDIPLDNLRMALGARFAKVEIFHTHPQRTVVRERNTFPGADRSAPVSEPPSFHDIINLKGVKMLINGEASNRVSGAVVDSIGTWTFDIDEKSAVMIQIDRCIRSMDRFTASISPQDTREILRFAAQQGRRQNYLDFAIGFFIVQNQNAWSPQLRSRVNQELAGPYNALSGSKDFVDFANESQGYYWRRNLTDFGARTKLMDIYWRAGVDLKFRPHLSNVASAR